MTDQVYVYLNLTYLDADGKWKPVSWKTPIDIYLDNPFYIYSAPEICLYTGDAMATPIYGESLYPAFLREVNLTPSNPTVTVSAYRFAYYSGTPPIKYRFMAIQTDLIWGADTEIELPVHPLEPTGTVNVYAVNSKTGEVINQTFDIGGSTYPFTVESGDKIYVTLKLHTTPYDLSISGYLSTYYTADNKCGFKEVGLETVQTSKTIKEVLVLPPGKYGVEGSEIGPVVFKFDDTNYVSPEYILARIYVTVEATSTRNLEVVTSLPDTVNYKKSYGLMGVMGMVYGTDGELMPNTKVVAEVHDNSGNTVYSTYAITGNDGSFTMSMNFSSLPTGTYTLVFKTPDYPQIKPDIHTLNVYEAGGTFFIISAPSVVASNMSFAVKVQAYIGDPTPIVGEPVNIWYTNMTYSPQDTLQWNYLGQYQTDDTGTIATNIPPNATTLKPGADQGVFYILVDPTRDGVIDPSKVYTTPDSLSNLTSTSNQITTLVTAVTVLVPQNLTSQVNLTNYGNATSSAASSVIFGGNAYVIPIYYHILTIATLVTPLVGVILLKRKRQP